MGLIVYGVGALMSAVSPGLGVLIVGNSILDGVGTALLIPPVYILTTMLFTSTQASLRPVDAESVPAWLVPPGHSVTASWRSRVVTGVRPRPRPSPASDDSRAAVGRGALPVDGSS